MIPQLYIVERHCVLYSQVEISENDEITKLQKGDFILHLGFEEVIHTGLVAHAEASMIQVLTRDGIGWVYVETIESACKLVCDES